MSVATEVDLRAVAERGAGELGPHATAPQLLPGPPRSSARS